MTTTVPAESVAFLRALTEHDPDVRCRRAAMAALRALAHGPSSIAPPARAARREGSAQPRPVAEVVAGVRASLLGDAGFPADLTGLGSLSEPAAVDLLSAIVEQLLGASSTSGRRMPERAV